MTTYDAQSKTQFASPRVLVAFASRPAPLHGGVAFARAS